MIVYAYVHQNNCIHLDTFWAFELPNVVSFLSPHVLAVTESLKCIFFSFPMSICFSPICSRGDASPEMRVHMADGDAACAKCNGYPYYSLDEKFGSVFLLSCCLESSLQIGLSLTDHCLWQSVCAYRTLLLDMVCVR